mmetsp:Transcript_46/g.75  ORF Transcript_46/g.75 Transcript_46/m.75 type:complete len:236 (-) Transcript_46:165-872(-)
MGKSALDLIDQAIAGLEAQLNLAPGESLAATTTNKQAPDAAKPKKEKKKPAPPRKKAVVAAPPEDQPAICKLLFKVGQITKVWVHEKADKLYCEEIDCGEEAPRQIASGLRPHYTEEQMLGQRLLVVANLKAKNLVGFKSHGMVLCASQMKEDGSELVEFIEPPADAPLGEIITFEGLPPPQPVSAAQVEKKKVFAACMDGMKTTADCEAAWDGHKFMTTAGPCKSKTIREGVMR